MQSEMITNHNLILSILDVINKNKMPPHIRCDIYTISGLHNYWNLVIKFSNKYSDIFYKTILVLWDSEKSTTHREDLVDITIYSGNNIYG